MVTSDHRAGHLKPGSSRVERTDAIHRLEDSSAVSSLSVAPNREEVRAARSIRGSSIGTPSPVPGPRFWGHLRVAPSLRCAEANGAAPRGQTGFILRAHVLVRSQEELS